jgi:hypothetical protein
MVGLVREDIAMRFGVLAGRLTGLVLGLLLVGSQVVYAQEQVFARGEDGSLMHYDGTRWQSLGARIVGAPDACSWGAGRIDVVVRGTDNKLWQIAFANGAWTTWIMHDGNLGSSPTCVSWGPNRIDVFAVDAETRAMQQKAWDGTRWSGWESIGGVFPLGAAPDAVSNGPNDITLVARGSDDAIWRNQHGASGWAGWNGISPSMQSDPGAIAFGGGRVDIFAQGTDAQMMRSSGGAFSGLGGVFTRGDGPDGVSTGSGNFVLYVRGSDGELWRGRGSASAFAGWGKVGGHISSDPAAVSAAGSGGSPAPAVARGRFRVTLTGFHVRRPTWDDILERDGKWDEVFFVVDSATVRRDGALEGTRRIREAVVIGDTNNAPTRRRGGSASDLGGLKEGDAHPVDVAALRRPPAALGTSGEPPFVAFEGELVDGEKGAVIVPTVWEWDPPMHLHDPYLAGIQDGLAPCARDGAPQLWDANPISRITGRCTPANLRLSTVRIGEAAARPIGMTPAGDQYTFSPWVVGLNYRGAMALTASGPGVIPVRYVDYEDLKGDYELFLVVERLD